MSDLIERLINAYHLRLIPTVKRMCARRRVAYTLLTMGVLWISALTLSLLVFHTADLLSLHGQLSAEYRAFAAKSPLRLYELIPNLEYALSAARAESIASALLGGTVWLFVSVTVMGRVMSSVIESEAYVYGLYMICGAGRKQIRRQLSSEFLLEGIAAVLLGIPAGYAAAGCPANGVLLSALLILFCFPVLIFTCASVLAKTILNRPCLQMLNTADTSAYTVSPRRSRASGRNNALSSAALALWRMRKHSLAQALAVAVTTALIFGTLSFTGQDLTVPQPTFRVQLSRGVDAKTFHASYLDTLQNYPAVRDLQYCIGNTAEALGTHILISEEAAATTDTVYMGNRFATDSLRIACGDGDTYYELGGNVTVPPEYRDLEMRNELTPKGYSLDAVPIGGATYVYPEDMEHPMPLGVGDTFRLYLPSDGAMSFEERVAEDSRYITVEITSVVKIPQIRVKRGGEKVCPRITEDYLYLNPLDYGLVTGQTVAHAFNTEEAYPSDLFKNDDGKSCILVVPKGYFDGTLPLDTVTVIAPEEPVTEPFTANGGQKVLPDDTYFVNHTSKGMLLYFGTAKEYNRDADAYDYMTKYVRKNLSRYTEIPVIPMKATEYRVKRVFYTDAGAPYLLLPRSSAEAYTAMQNEICAFKLEIEKEIESVTPESEIIWKILTPSRLRIMPREAFVVKANMPISKAYIGRTCFLGTSLLADFVTEMEANGLHLLADEATYTLTKTFIMNRFSLSGQNYFFGEEEIFLAEPLSADSFFPDFYPRYVTPTGSFIVLNDVEANSFLSAADLDIFALFHEDNIGSLRDSATAIPGLYACNDWHVTPAPEADPGLNLSDGHGVFVTDTAAEDCPVRAGDILQVAVRMPLPPLQDDLNLMALRGTNLLAYLLDQMEYTYVEITVDEVRTGERCELLLSETDMATVLAREGLYTDMSIYLYDSATMTEFLEYAVALNACVGKGTPIDTYTRFLTDNRAGPEAQGEALRRIGLSALCALPLILLAAQMVFCEKRTEEWWILRSIGRTRRQRRAQFIAETGLLTLLLSMVTAAACPLGYLLVMMLAERIGTSLPPSAFDPRLYIGILALVVVSGLLAGGIAYGRLEARRSDSRPRRKEPNKEVSHESSGM